MKYATIALMLLVSGPVLADPVVRDAQVGDLAVISPREAGGFCSAQNNLCVNSRFGIDPASLTNGEGIKQAFSAAAVAAAMQDAVPNPGDRFAVRFGAAGNGSHFAGAVGVSLNITDRARVSLNYGQARRHSIVSGGLNLSFK